MDIKKRTQNMRAQLVTHSMSRVHEEYEALEMVNANWLTRFLFRKRFEHACKGSIESWARYIESDLQRLNDGV